MGGAGCYLEKSASSNSWPPPPYQTRFRNYGDGGISGPLALSSTASPPRNLGTGTIRRVPVAAVHHPTLITPPPGAPLPAAQKAPILRATDDNIPDVPVPPPMVYARRMSRGDRSASAQRKSAAMPVIVESPRSTTAPHNRAGPSVVVQPPSSSPTEDFIPIIHKRIPQKINTNIPPPPPIPSDNDDDDDYTPITPAPSPYSPRAKGIKRAGPLLSPRDALGIPISKFRLPGRSKSKRAAGASPEDLEPLSPSVNPQGGAEGLLSVPDQPREKQPKRRTVWGIIDGWWDLGLLERGKSLRRKEGR